MCVVAAKYIDGVGWVAVKNRDRNYKPIIKLRKSFRQNIERLYIWDMKTKYTEGVNEFGVGIISASVMVKEDENEVKQTKRKKKEQALRNGTYYAPDGKKIRTALLEKTVERALEKIIKSKVPGNTLVFDKDRCFLVEGAFLLDDDGVKTDNYEYKKIEIKKDEIVVRTNHGVLLPHAGYQDGPTPEEKLKRKSTLIRRDKVIKALEKATTSREVLDAVSITDDENPQLNPLRLDTSRGAMRTTGQILIEPGECVLHYRPIWSEVFFDIDKINHNQEKTTFEISSLRKLMTFREFFNSYKK